MSVDVAAADALAAFQRAFPESLAAAQRRNEPAWLLKARQDAFARFVERGFPVRRDEEWKYTNVQPLAKTPFAAASAAFTWKRPPAGVSIEPLETALAAAPEAHRAERMDALQEALAGAHAAEHAFSSLNTALFATAAVVRIAPGAVVAEPIEVRFDGAPDGKDGAPSAAHPRLIVLAGDGAQATLIESHASEASRGGHLANVVADVSLGAGAVLEHVKVQECGTADFHIAMNRVRLAGRAAVYRSRVLTFGAALSRNDLHVTLAAEGAECALDGLYVLDGAQHGDNHTLIDHAVPHTTSREHYKGVLDGKARGVFFGRILVRKGAQKTSAEQENNNLLLSRQALATSTPQLEIFADDVQCRHGSTIGQIDDLPLFYLRSRGIGEADARRIMTYAFVNEIIQRIGIASLRDRLAERLIRLGPGDAS